MTLPVPIVRDHIYRPQFLEPKIPPWFQDKFATKAPSTQEQVFQMLSDKLGGKGIKALKRC
jgi:hypothetical protein